MNPLKKQHRAVRQKNLSLRALQAQGYILPFILILLITLMVGSASFFNRTISSGKLSGASRDYDQALLLAESGGNWLAGRFVNGDTTAYTGIGCAAASMVGDINCDGTRDDDQGHPANFAPANALLALGYQFYLRDNTNAFRTTGAAEVLQLVADGEARNELLNAAFNNNGILPGATPRLRVNDLFVSAAIRPILLVQSATGLTRSTATWNLETAPEKAAVWMELSRNPDATHPNWFDMYVCSVAKVGSSKAYLQRYIGSYTDPTLGSTVVAPISEAANHG